MQFTQFGRTGLQVSRLCLQVGDILETTPPSGDFHLPDVPTRPVILLSGGVGLTPMVSMAETIIDDLDGVQAHFVHGTLNSETHAMASHMRALAGRASNLRVATFYSEPGERDVLGTSHEGEGFISVDWLAQHTPLGEADVFLCGPRPFLHFYVRELALAGVPATRIHYEFFGPADELVAA